MKTLKIILICILIAFIIIQFLPKRLPENLPADGRELTVVVNVPDNVSSIIKNSCYDCHSNQSKYPWYSHIAPTAWLVGGDVKEARHDLNFSEWGDYSKRDVIGKLDAISDEVSSGGMPLPAYAFIHRKTKLSEEQVQAIVKWSQQMSDSILN